MFSEVKATLSYFQAVKLQTALSTVMEGGHEVSWSFGFVQNRSIMLGLLIVGCGLFCPATRWADTPTCAEPSASVSRV